MSTLNKALRKLLETLPRSVLQKILGHKLDKVGVSIAPSTLAALSEHILSGNDEAFVWDDGSGEDRTTSLEITEEDVKHVDDSTTRVLKELPRIVESTVAEISRRIFNSLVSNWESEHTTQTSELLEFRTRLEERWGKGLGFLRMLLTCCREMGQEASRRYGRSRAMSFRCRRWVLERLHLRACQVSDEIICLIENGFADGAMARWRTLHEISVVGVLIAEGDEDLAERYILHDAVEAKRQADEYEQSQVSIGARPLRKRQRMSIESAYAAVVSRFGPSFAHPYGWASEHLRLKKPTFKDLLIASGRCDSGTHYKQASFSIHASARSLFFNLGAIGDESIMFSGRSNAGLREPGELTAHALTLVTALFVGNGSDLDRIILMNCVLKIRNSVSPTLRQSERQLARETHALQTSSASCNKVFARKGRQT